MKRRKTKWSKGEMPRELLASPPRAARLSGGAVAALLLALATIVAGYVGAVWQTLRVERSEQRAAVVTATVTRLDRKNGKGPYFVAYSYTAGDREYARTVRLKRGQGRGFSVGSPIHVRYLPERPGSAWIDGYGPDRNAVWAFVALAGIGALAVVAIGAVARRNARLLTTGRAVLARVVGADRVKHAEAKTWRVRFDYEAMSGAVRTGSFNTTAKPPPAGARIPIVYDRENPRRYSRYPPALVRLKK
jgi:hypothetical protein